MKCLHQKINKRRNKNINWQMSNGFHFMSERDTNSALYKSNAPTNDLIGFWSIDKIWWVSRMHTNAFNPLHEHTDVRCVWVCIFLCVFHAIKWIGIHLIAAIYMFRYILINVMWHTVCRYLHIVKGINLINLFHI